MTANIHPFEKAGLGKAPFRCVGCRENRFEMPGFGFKPGGCCDFCGTGILYEFVIKSADGAEFVVGSDCVRKTEAEVANFNAVRLEHARAKRAIKVAERRTLRQKAYDEAREQSRAVKFLEWYAINKPLADRLEAYAGSNAFIADMKKSATHWGGLTPNQTSAVARCFDRMDADAIKPVSQYVGNVGDRVTFNLKVEKTLDWTDRSSFPIMYRFCNLCTDEHGNVIKYIGSKVLDSGVYKATIKAHEEYNGVKQTRIQRPM